MSSTLPTVSRRRVLVGAVALALLGATATACGSTAPVRDVDDLLSQLERARTDAQLARDAAAGAPPKLAAPLAVVAAERAAHAQALTDEITRLSGEPPATPMSSSKSASSTSEPAPTASGPPPKPPTAADVVAALKESAAGAALLATQQSGYRAGLLGSIAAACTAATTVTFADLGQTS